MIKGQKNITLICYLTLCFATFGCQRVGSIWDSLLTTRQPQNKNTVELWGKDHKQQLVKDQQSFAGPENEDFLPLSEEDLYSVYSEETPAQPRYSPGEEGSGIPGFSAFQSPEGQMKDLFQNVYFNTDEHMIRGREHVDIIRNIATYLKDHANTYIFVEGNCDERGPEAYNLSLGSRRANYIRSLLVKYGVNAEQIYTVSYGKEKPCAFGHSAQDWAKNRRCEFKIYQK